MPSKKRINKEEFYIYFKRYSLVIVGILMAAISFNLFSLPNELVIGGVSGVSIIIDNFLEISPATFIFMCSAILLVVSYILLGKKRTINSILGSMLFPLFVKLTENIGDYVVLSSSDLILPAIFCGVTSGFGFGLVFKSGFTTGGTDIINQIVSKYAKISMGKAMIITDGLIVLGGVFTFGWTKVLYAILILYIMTSIADRVMLGISDNKLFYIVTSKVDEVKEFIMKELETGVTVLEGQGAYSGKDKQVLMCVITTKDYFRLKEGIKNIDKDIFFTITDSYEVSGGH